VAPDYKGRTPNAVEGHQLYKGTCHCGRVGVALMSKPLDATFDELMVKCNCSLCKQVGDLLTASLSFGLLWRHQR